MRGGWGKIDAAAAAQYGISRWQPSVVINLGTCGDLVSDEENSEMDGKPELFAEGSRTIMRRLFDVLPMWVGAAVRSQGR